MKQRCAPPDSIPHAQARARVEVYILIFVRAHAVLVATMTTKRGGAWLQRKAQAAEREREREREVRRGAGGGGGRTCNARAGARALHRCHVKARINNKNKRMRVLRQQQNTHGAHTQSRSSFSLRTARSLCLHLLRAAFEPHALQPPHTLLRAGALSPTHAAQHLAAAAQSKMQYVYTLCTRVPLHACTHRQQ